MMKTINAQQLRISGCSHVDVPYTTPMRKKWNYGLWLCLSLLALIGSGCGGFSATRSISPATFLLPGLLHNTNPAQETPSLTEPLPAETPAHKQFEPVLLADAQF
jgi:hypothetical protein